MYVLPGYVSQLCIYKDAKCACRYANTTMLIRILVCIIEVSFIVRLNKRIYMNINNKSDKVVYCRYSVFKYRGFVVFCRAVCRNGHLRWVLLNGEAVIK